MFGHSPEDEVCCIIAQAGFAYSLLHCQKASAAYCTSTAALIISLMIESSIHQLGKSRPTIDEIGANRIWRAQ